ncbi:MAG: outer membrane beta-barrel protein [Luteibaculum sp.]
MKKLIILLAAGLISASLFAQPEKGRVLIGGNFGFSVESGESLFTPSAGTTDTIDNPTQTNFETNILGGYFVTNRIAPVLNIMIGTSVVNDESNDIKTTGRTFGLGIGARYYQPVAGTLFFTGSLGFGFSKTTQESKTGSTTTEGPTTNTTGINVSPGLSFFPSPSVAFELSIGNLGYTREISEIESPAGNKTKTTVGTFDFGVDLTSLNIGVIFLFGGSPATP